MNLEEFTSGTPATKPWLTIVAKSAALESAVVDDLSVTEVTSSLISLADTGGVPNPPVGYVSFYSDGTDFKSVNPLGVTTTYATTAGGPYLPTDGGVMSGPINMNGNNILNCPELAGNPFLPESGGVMSGDIDMAGSSILDCPELEPIVPIASQVTPLPPPGQRDLWAYATGATGSGMIYSSDFDLVLSGSPGGGASYSADGGVTFSPCIFDVPPVGAVILGANPVVVVALTTSGQSYTSPDGINYTQGAAPPAGAISFNIDWFAAAGVFVTGGNVDPTHQIMTSPDGLVWTAQVSSLTGVNVVHSNGSICVATASIAPFIMSSPDGVTWTDTSSTVVVCRAVAWSEDKKEWLVAANLISEAFVSPDGMVWTSVGAVLPPLAGNSILWVGGDIQRWYAAAPDSANNYSLRSSPSSAEVFVGTSLDGARLNTLQYAIAYDASRSRFLLGVNNAPRVAYSTARPYDIKALSDNIRVRGAPVHTDQYSAYSDVALNNTVVETDISTAASFIGSQRYEAAQPLGSVFVIDLNLVVSSAAGDTLTVRYKTNGGLLFTHVLTVPALSVNLPINIHSKVSVRAATIQVNSTENISATAPVTVSATPAYNRAIANVWTITGQWGAALSTLTMNSLTYETLFRNGA